MALLGFQVAGLVLSAVALAQNGSAETRKVPDMQAVKADINQRLRDAAELVKRGDYAAAEPALRAIVEAGEQSADTLASTASALHLLGVVCEDLHRYTDAQKYYLRALRIWDGLGVVARKHRVESLANLSSVYMRTGKFTQAERLLRSVTQIGDRELDDGNRAAILSNLANLAYTRGNFAEAQRLLEQVVNIWERVYGAGDINLVGPLNGLASACVKMRDYAAALRYLHRAQSILEKTRNPVFLAHILVNLSTVRVLTGDAPEAELLLKQALELATSSVGTDSPLAGEILANYAAVLKKMGRKGEAKEFAKRASAIRRSARQTDPARYTIDIDQLAHGKK